MAETNTIKGKTFIKIISWYLSTLICPAFILICWFEWAKYPNAPYIYSNEDGLALFIIIFVINILSWVIFVIVKIFSDIGIYAFVSSKKRAKMIISLMILSWVSVLLLIVINIIVLDALSFAFNQSEPELRRLAERIRKDPTMTETFSPQWIGYYKVGKVEIYGETVLIRLGTPGESEFWQAYAYAPKGLIEGIDQLGIPKASDNESLFFRSFTKEPWYIMNVKRYLTPPPPPPKIPKDFDKESGQIIGTWRLLGYLRGTEILSANSVESEELWEFSGDGKLTGKIPLEGAFSSSIEPFSANYLIENNVLKVSNIESPAAFRFHTDEARKIAFGLPPLEIVCYSKHLILQNKPGTMFLFERHETP